MNSNIGRSAPWLAAVTPRLFLLIFCFLPSQFLGLPAPFHSPYLLHFPALRHEPPLCPKVPSVSLFPEKEDLAVWTKTVTALDKTPRALPSFHLFSQLKDIYSLLFYV